MSAFPCRLWDWGCLKQPGLRPQHSWTSPGSARLHGTDTKSWSVRPPVSVLSSLFQSSQLSRDRDSCEWREANPKYKLLLSPNSSTRGNEPHTCSGMVRTVGSHGSLQGKRNSLQLAVFEIPKSSGWESQPAVCAEALLAQLWTSEGGGTQKCTFNISSGTLSK